jgi:endonuclease YncB( thermonuclease family)
MIAEEAEPRARRALVAIPPRPIRPAGLRVGTVFYLISVGLIAAATLGASLGMGFYLLVHPQQQAAAASARSSDADTGLRTPDEGAAAAQPELASPTSEASVEGEPRDHNRNASPPGQAGKPAGEPSNSAEVINGIVTDVRDVATWTVGGRTVRLFGINPGAHKHLASLVNWVRAKGPVECMPQARTPLYRCFTATGEDIAEAALLAGIGRAGERATAAYENAESSARRMGKGLWARR